MAVENRAKTAGSENIPPHLSWRTLIIAFSGLVLIVLVVMITHFSTSRTLSNLQQSSFDALSIFSINHQLEGVVNAAFKIDLSFHELAAIEPLDLAAFQELSDSIEHVRKKVDALQEEFTAHKSSLQMNAFAGMLRQRLDYLDSLISLGEQNDAIFKDYINTVEGAQPDEGVLEAALYVQLGLEKALRESIVSNAELSDRVLTISRIFSIAAILGIAFVGTLLIRRLLHNEQLLHELELSRREAWQLSKVQDRFLANISHELRTPIHAITGFAALLDKKGLNPRQQHYITLIQNSGQILLGIINDLLDSLRIREGKLEITPRVFVVKELLQQLHDLFYELTRKKKLHFAIHIHGELPEALEGDPDRLQQVLINLLSNASQNTAEGYVKLVVEAGQMEGDTIWVNFNVHDSGTGIAEADRDRIFEPFEQVVDKGMPTNGGAGLGLNIVKNLVTLMGGTIGLESGLKQGSIFRLSLPFGLPSAEAVSQLNTAIEEKLFRTLPVYAGARVLLVEDNKVNQLLMLHLLAQYGILPDVAENGLQAIEMVGAAKEPYHLILMDLQMPELSGSGAALKLKELPNFDTPIVALTAHLESSLPGLLGDWVPDAQLSKPLKETDLNRVLEQFLAGCNAAQQSVMVDWKWVEDNYGTLPGAPTDILNAFVKELQKHMQAIRETLPLEDAGKLQPLVHHMLSTTGAIGDQSPLYQLTLLIREKLHISPIDWTLLMLHKQVWMLYAKAAIREVQLLTAIKAE